LKSDIEAAAFQKYGGETGFEQERAQRTKIKQSKVTLLVFPFLLPFLSLLTPYSPCFFLSFFSFFFSFSFSFLSLTFCEDAKEGTACAGAGEISWYY
jgi:hypothetical protein